MRIIGTNKLLFRCHITQSSLCDFYNMHVESINHLFWECNVTQHFWSHIDIFLSNNGLQTKIDFYTISFGIIDDNIREKQIQFIILLAKSFIFKCKYNKRELVFECFLQYLKRSIAVEKCIAQRKDKLEQHINKWRQLDI